MADVLLELGRAPHSFSPVHLSQSGPRSTIVDDIVEFVAILENPLVQTYDPIERIDPRVERIAARLRAISGKNRLKLVESAKGASLSGPLAIVNASQYGQMIHDMGAMYDLGKLGGFFSKIRKVIKNPAVLKIAGLASGFIPGVGLIAAPMISAIAAKSAARQAGLGAAEQMVAMAGAAQETYSTFSAIKQEQGEEAKRVAERETAVTDAKALVAEAEETGSTKLIDAAKADLKVAEDAVVAARPEVLSSLFPGVSPNLLSKAEAFIPGIKGTIEGIGKNEFLGSALKGIGQIGGIGAMLGGTGAETSLAGIDLGGVLGGITDKLSGASGLFGDILGAGITDIETSASAGGQGNAVSNAIDRGLPSEFPIVPVAIAGGVVVVGGAVFALSGRRG